MDLGACCDHLAGLKRLIGSLHPDAEDEDDDD